MGAAITGPTCRISDRIYSKVIDSEAPGGRWGPGLRLLVALRADGWAGLSKIVQIRLEGLIVKDVLAGYKDVHSIKVLSGGHAEPHKLERSRRHVRPLSTNATESPARKLPPLRSRIEVFPQPIGVTVFHTKYILLCLVRAADI